MTLKQTRNILSFVIILIFIAGGIIAAGNICAHYTVGSGRYIQSRLEKNISQYSKENFEARLDALEKKSGIPKRVFTAVYNGDNLSGTVAQRIIDGSDASLYNNMRISEFDKLIREYLDGNSIKYDEEKVYNTATEAARIYAECFGIQNADSLRAVIIDINRGYQRNASIGIMLMLVSVILFLVLFSKLKNAVIRIMSAAAGLGLTMLVTGVICLIFRVGQHALVTPQIYADAVNLAVRGAFAFTAAAGVIIAAGASVLSFFIYSSDIKRTETEY